MELVAGNRRIVDRSSRRFTGSFPTAWAASVWKGTPASEQIRPNSSTGWTTPCLAVHPLNRYQGGLRGDCLPQVVRIDDPASADKKQHDFGPFTLDPFESGEDGGVFDDGGNDPFPGPEKLRMTVLFASVAPLVKTMEPGSHPVREASDDLALRTFSRERSPAA